MFHCTCVWLFMDHIYNCHIRDINIIVLINILHLQYHSSPVYQRLLRGLCLIRSATLFFKIVSHIASLVLYVTVPHCSSFSSILIFYILPLITASNIRELKDAQGLDKTTSSSPNQFPLSHAHYLLLPYLLSNFKLSKGTPMDSNIL